MTTETIDLRASNSKVYFVKGATLKQTLYYLDDQYAAVDLTGYTAIMPIYLLPTDTIAVITLTTENGGLEIVTGTARIEAGAELPDGTTAISDIVVANAMGVNIYIDNTTTGAIAWDKAYFHLHLIDTNADIVPFIKGELIPNNANIDTK